MVDLRSGELRHVATFERLVDTGNLDAQGNIVWEWEPHPQARAVHVSIEFVGGGELERGRSLESVTTHRIKLRFLPGLTSQMRIRVADGRLFEINRIGDPSGRQRALFADCRELES